MPVTSSHGGRKLDAFVEEHFTKEGDRHPTTKRYKMRCKYCPEGSPLVEHRDKRCISHISKIESCPQAPLEVRKEAMLLLASSHGLSMAATGSEKAATGTTQEDAIELDSDKEADGEEPSKKKQKTGSGQTTMDLFVDRPMSKEEKEDADMFLLRFLIHAGIAFRASEHPYLKKWASALRPLYKVPTRYVLVNSYLPAEEARVVLEEIGRLEKMKLLTLMTDGWEDVLRRSVYGTLLAELGVRPIVLGLSDLTGERGTAAKILEVVELALKKKNATARQIIALVTDNPTTMQAFRRMFVERYPWVISTYCFLHALNTVVGRITTFPAAKRIVSMNTKVVSFFNSSHYWGGQLEATKTRHNITRSLKTHTATRWYSLILQAQSVQEYRPALIELCLRPDAQVPQNRMSTVNTDIIDMVLSPAHWRLNAQLIRICKPLVDAIGNLESRDANLADCMLELIWAARQIAILSNEDGDDPSLTQHAKKTVRQGFHEMNTDLHWFVLFLQPLSRSLAISSATHSRTIEKAYEFALDVAVRWNWSEESATKLLADITQYAAGAAPFSGGTANAKEWWSNPLLDEKSHPLKSMALRLFSIVPHSAEIERLFSNLAGVQSPKRCRLTVALMETLGILRNYYTTELAGGKPVRRRHAHMHTGNGSGINTEKLTELMSQWAFETDSSAVQSEDELAGPEDITLDDIEEAYRQLESDQLQDGDGDGLEDDVAIEAVYAVGELERIRKGLASPEPEKAAAEHDGSTGGSRKWTPQGLLKSLGL